MVKLINRILVSLLPALCMSLQVSAQDPLFSQFYAMPTYLNPALTGGFNAKYRVSTIYRDQWSGPLEQSISSFGAGLDLRFDLKSQALSGDVAAAGLQFFSDQAGSLDLSTNSIAVSGAFHKSLDRSNKNYLSAGFQLSTVQRNVLYENLYFQDQFDGVNAYTGATGEDLPTNNYSFTDAAVGINFVGETSLGLQFFVGAAAQHILEPEISFYRKDEDEAQQALSTSRLFRRYTAHAGVTTALNDDISISPRAFFTTMGPHMQASLGNNFIIEPSSTDAFNFHVGAWLRVVQDFEQSVALDVLGLMTGVGVGNLFIGLSYDINLRDLTQFGTRQGSFELSLSYFGDYEDEGSACPTF